VSDSTERPVSIELTPADWQYVLYRLDLDGGDAIAIAYLIRGQIPEFPTGLGAVIRARRSGEASEQIYVLSAQSDNEMFHHRWRAAAQHGGWINSRDLELVEILAPGVDL
jgi:hypothetical protein